ncbi:hypothetical protein Droror1_Dr00012156, partial [Drosera rotundifolia]
KQQKLSEIKAGLNEADVLTGFVNSLAFARSREFLVAGIGQVITILITTRLKLEVDED